jgi:hypothetical protein
MIIRAITLWQPWATLVALGLKQYETRSWSTRYRGWLAIHAAKRDPDVNVFAAALQDMRTRGWYSWENIPRGAVVAVVRLVACHSTEGLIASPREQLYGNWAPGRWAWELRDVVCLEAHPIPTRGSQGLWSWQEPAELELPGVAT